MENADIRTTVLEVFRSYGASIAVDRSHCAVGVLPPADADRVLDDLSMRNLGESFCIFRPEGVLRGRLEAYWGVRGVRMREKLERN